MWCYHVDSRNVVIISVLGLLSWNEEYRVIHYYYLKRAVVITVPRHVLLRELQIMSNIWKVKRSPPQLEL